MGQLNPVGRTSCSSHAPCDRVRTTLQVNRRFGSGWASVRSFEYFLLPWCGDMGGHIPTVCITGAVGVGVSVIHRPVFAYNTAVFRTPFHAEVGLMPRSNLVLS